MYFQTRIILASIYLMTMSLFVGTHAANYEGFLPKNITGVSAFLKEHSEYDGRNIKIAVLDSGVDPGAPGLSTTSQGLPKVVDILDATGSGDVDTSATGNPDKDAQVKGLSGRTLQLDPQWIKSNPTIHLGVVNGFDLFPDYVIGNYKKHARELMQETNKVYIQSTKKALETLNAEDSKDSTKKKDLEDRLELLDQMEESYDAPSPVFDCVVFQMGDHWRVAIDTDEDGDLRDEDLLEDYSISQQYAQFGQETLINFGVHTYKDGNLLSIIIPSSAHGTHVAGIIGAHYPESPGRNGIAPGAQIVSIKIGDTRLDGMETGIALQRALRMVKELDCDLINMSYGEPTCTPNQGWFIEQVDELVREHNVIFVASAGNAGPALSTVGAPGGTSSSILAVGAYIHSSMMALQYGMAHTSQNNLYTWSSRGPTTDGDLGVNFCAPGGAIAPVPTSSQVPAMQMNGTSMASPYACGTIALILSGLQSKDTPYTPYSVRMALEDSAQLQGHLDAFSQGYGLIQVNEAFKLLQSPEQNTSKIGFEIQNISQSSGRGVYLREIIDSPTTHAFRIQPIFADETDVLTKSTFEIWAKLSSEASWVTYPDSVILHQNGGKMSVTVDSSKLRPGAHSTYIAGKDQLSGKTLFKVPVSIIVPSSSAANNQTDWNKTVSLQPGDVRRFFLKPPTWAKWAEVSIQSNQPIKNDRLALHTVQLLESHRFNAAEWKRYIPGDSLAHYETFIPVHGNPMMEWGFASYWSNRDSMELKINIKFQGLDGIQKTYHLASGGIPSAGSIQGVHGNIELQPKGELTEAAFSLLPTTASIHPSEDPRDLLVNDHELHQLNLVYEWENVEAKSLNVHWNALAEVIYDSPYSSFFWNLEGPSGRIITYDDAWSDPIEIEKGIHRINLSIWHEDTHLLESLKKLPMNLSHPLSQSIPIHLEKTLKAASTPKFEKSRFGAIKKGENHSFWLSTKVIPKNNTIGPGITKNYSGYIQWLDSKNHHGAVLLSKVVVSTSAKANINSEQPNQPDFANINQDLDTNWWLLRLDRLKQLAQLDGNSESFDSLYDALLSEKPHSLKIQKILLTRLDGPNRKENLDSLLPLLDQMMQQMDIGAIRTYFSIRNTAKSKPEREQETKMHGEKALLLDLLYRKARALAYQETLLKKQTSAFDDTLAELRSWVDTNETKYRLLDIREYRRKGSYGSALKLLNTSIKTDKANLKLLKKKMKILQSLNWTFWADDTHLHSYLSYPNQVTSVQFTETP